MDTGGVILDLTFACRVIPSDFYMTRRVQNLDSRIIDSIRVTLGDKFSQSNQMNIQRPFRYTLPILKIYSLRTWKKNQFY